MVISARVYNVMYTEHNIVGTIFTPAWRLLCQTDLGMVANVDLFSVAVLSCYFDRINTGYELGDTTDPEFWRELCQQVVNLGFGHASQILGI